MLAAQGRLALADGTYRRTDDLATLPVPETLAALVASRLAALDPAGPTPGAGAGGPGPTAPPAGRAGAAGFCEGMGSDELAGALAGHYLAAQRSAAEGPQAEALAAQARIAL